MIEVFTVKRVFVMLLSAVLAMNFAACQSSAEKSTSQTGAAASGIDKSSLENTSSPSNTIAQTGFTTAVPEEYKQAAEHQGEVVRLEYDSLDYLRDSTPITKTAYVYLPYGYDETDSSTHYNIVYLMHGWGGHAGEYFEYTPTKNMFDNLIENGDIPSVIIVSATFYNENSSTDFSSSIAEFREFHRDFEENLMPAVNRTSKKEQ